MCEQSTKGNNSSSEKSKYKNFPETYIFTSSFQRFYITSMTMQQSFVVILRNVIHFAEILKVTNSNGVIKSFSYAYICWPNLSQRNNLINCFLRSFFLFQACVACLNLQYTQYKSDMSAICTAGYLFFVKKFFFYERKRITNIT